MYLLLSLLFHLCTIVPLNMHVYFIQKMPHSDTTVSTDVVSAVVVVALLYLTTKRDS